MVDAFKPIADSTVSLSCTTGTARVQLVGTSVNRVFQLRLHNAGSATVFVKLGSSTVTATTTNLPIPAGAIEVLTFAPSDTLPLDYIAAITASGTATLYATTGQGI